MFRVHARAIPRNIGGNIFQDFWSAGLHWSGLEGTTRELTQEQLDAVKKDQDNGFAIKILSVEEILPPTTSTSAPVAPSAPEKTTTAALKQSESTTTTAAPKAPWEK